MTASLSLVSCKNLESQQYDVLLKSNWKVLDFSVRQIKPNHCYPKMVLCVWDSVKICEADFGVIDFLSPMKKWVVLLYLDLSNQALENTSSQTVPSNGQLKWEWILHLYSVILRVIWGCYVFRLYYYQLVTLMLLFYSIPSTCTICTWKTQSAHRCKMVLPAMLRGNMSIVQ